MKDFSFTLTAEAKLEILAASGEMMIVLLISDTARISYARLLSSEIEKHCSL